MKKYIGFAFFSCLLLAASVPASLAGGLSCSLGEVVVDQLQVGQSYDLTQLTNTRVMVTNTDSNPVRMRMEILAPEESELKLNAEIIPDPTWVKLSQSEFDVPAGGRAEAGIRITIPDEDRYLHRRFQVMIWSHTIPTSESGMYLACGLKSRLIFSTDSVRQAPANDLAESASSSLQLEPAEINWDCVKSHRDRQGETVEHRTITIRNTGDHDEKVRLEGRAVQDTYSALTVGYEELPDQSFITFGEPELMLPAHTSRDVDVQLKCLSAALVSGKRYMMIIRAASEGTIVSSQVYSRLYLTLN